MPFFKRKEIQKSTVPVKGPSSVKRSPSIRNMPPSPDLLSGDIGIPSSLLDSNQYRNSPTLILLEESLKSPEDLGDLATSPFWSLKTSSRLSKTLLEILHDKDALHCFIQFMEFKQAECFIRFWLDAESFRAATLTRIHTHSLQSVSRSGLLKRREEMKDGVAGLASENDQSKIILRSEHTPDVHTLVEEDAEGMVKTFSEKSKLHSCKSSTGSVESGTSENIKGSYDNKPVNNIGQTLPFHDSSHCEEAKHSTTQAVFTAQVREAHSNSENLSLQSIGSNHAKISSSLVGPCMVMQRSVDDSERQNECRMMQNSWQEETAEDSKSVDTLTDVISTPVSQAAKGAPIRENDISNDCNAMANQAVSVFRSSHLVSAEEIKEKLRKSIERDAVIIFTKYIAQDAPQSIGVDDHLRGETISKICQEDGQVNPECFVPCQDFVVRFMEQEYYKSFTDSEYHCKHQVNVLTSGKVYLADILYNEHALCYFLEFMDREGASHLMQFWMAADNFQQQLVHHQGNYDGMQAQADAMILYERFFSLQATTPLGFDDKIRFEIEGNICREEGPLPDCFSKPRDIILKNIEKVYFPRYLSGDIYYRYLSDLISTVQMAQDLPIRKHKRQASDASSEHSGGSQSTGAESISSRNTLLAMGSRTLRKPNSPSVGKLEEHFSTMDSDLLNPDHLWKQPSKVPLTVGKVDLFGQFMSEFDPYPDIEKKKGGGFFKRKKDKVKNDEEMALRVAQMIINDVVTMTKMGDACSRDDNASNSQTSQQASLSLTQPSYSGQASSSSLSSLAQSSCTGSFFEPLPS